MRDYKKMIPYANYESQKELLEYLSKNNTITKAMNHFERSESSIHRTLRAIEKRMTAMGDGEHFDLKENIPQGLSIKGTSTLMKDGEKVLQWIKTDKTIEDRLEQLNEAISEIVKEVEGKATPVKEPKRNNADELAVYNIGDAHIGMLAHRSESGHDFDLTIAERDLTLIMKRLVKSAPDSETAIIIDVGDFFLADNSSNETSHSGNKLDVDGRWFKVLQIGLNIMRKLVDEALTKHKKVIVKNAIGNHNEHSAIFISLFLDSWFRNEPRVEVDKSPAMFWYYKFGKNLIGVTHGHTIKPDKLGGVMSVDQKENWSTTDYRYWYTGHIHHQSVKEYENCVVETFRTLAAKDAWHSASGYRSGRDMKCIILHKDYGEIQRQTANLAML